MELTILMPCLNEAQTLASCIFKARGFLQRAGIEGEILIADNGSTDGSQDIARDHGARVVNIPERGYGAALIGGIGSARGRFIVMGDADDSYDFSRLDSFVEQLRAGAELVMGNRFRGGIAPGAMPPLHRYLGNPILSGVGRLFFPCAIRDFHCGLRGFKREAILKLDLQATGMEFASEMVVKALVHGLNVVEVPTTLVPDGRNRPPHLRSWRDGWRHLRFLLLFSPRWLFLYPGLALTLVGLLGLLWLVPSQRQLGSVVLGVHTLLFCGVATVLGVQAISFGMFSKVFAIQSGLLPNDSYITLFTREATLERGLIWGSLLTLAGLTGSVLAVFQWGEAGFGPLGTDSAMRLVIPSVTAILVGFQLAFAGFFLGVLQLGRRPRNER
jgi:glycosyltransferase involved in cell wall biosynthesis